MFLIPLCPPSKNRRASVNPLILNTIFPIYTCGTVPDRCCIILSAEPGLKRKLRRKYKELQQAFCAIEGKKRCSVVQLVYQAQIEPDIFSKLTHRDFMFLVLRQIFRVFPDEKRLCTFPGNALENRSPCSAQYYGNACMKGLPLPFCSISSSSAPRQPYIWPQEISLRRSLRSMASFTKKMNLIHIPNFTAKKR